MIQVNETGRFESAPDVSAMIKNSVLYFCLVFGAGFLLGPIRILILEPSVGQRTAELVEAPLMLAVILISGRWIGVVNCRFLSQIQTLSMGILTAFFILSADTAVGVGFRSMTVYQVFVDRDPITGPIYYGLVLIASLAPWWFKSRSVFPRSSSP